MLLTCHAADILFIAAAGNSGANNDVTASFPSNYPNSNIIAVAALTNTGALASYSQYGATTVDIAAPGSGIYSTVPVAGGRGKKATVAAGYASYNGTSMATPHVTGAAALYAARHPGSTAAQIKAAILVSRSDSIVMANRYQWSPGCFRLLITLFKQETKARRCRAFFCYGISAVLHRGRKTPCLPRCVQITESLCNFLK